MTTLLIDPPAHDVLAERVGDAALASLLQQKPLDEGIPASVWWLVAESLRTSSAVRRTLAVDASPDREDLPMMIAESQLLAQAALAELRDATGACPVPVDATDPRDRRSTATTRPTFGLQLSVLVLARMLVSHRATSPLRLANTLAAHLRALDVVRAAEVPQRSGGGVSRLGTTSVSCDASIAPARSSRGTSPVTSTIDDATEPPLGPPSR
jgi:hypothetical protein